jgi:16S rRNA (cytosine1402-N4)-methyltransferase
VREQQGAYLDATVGGGGHSLAFLQAGAAQIVALDQDPQALAVAQERLQTWLQERGLSPERVACHHLNFSQYQQQWQQHTPVLQFAGIIADLGVSSPQLDQPERGFSFSQTGPLDMRMDPTQGSSAADWINHSEEEVLAEIFWRYGEERYARRIARQIVGRRPLQTTTELANTVLAAVPPAARRGRIHPATRVFQALRIVVNQELEALATFLAQAPDWLRPGGRMGIISFHSLEDRQVKWAFRQDPRLQVVTAKPIQAGAEEVAVNPRARSAKLRIAARVESE